MDFFSAVCSDDDLSLFGDFFHHSPPVCVCVFRLHLCVCVLGRSCVRGRLCCALKLLCLFLTAASNSSHVYVRVHRCVCEHVVACVDVYTVCLNCCVITERIQYWQSNRKHILFDWLPVWMFSAQIQFIQEFRSIL